ncbi:helix-turn-helix domain-containing protein [Synechocystis sp. FACHB-383]|uniref:helix-turn-helix domain-containing protein n=1 Tax=Synechocystis sp. FACHB-383 TaxID=2692864 RepID=UPI001686201D|nr:helix-turn-helix domain-containing protein [Synechocystis sp. FACHB-383]MBD2653125.1 helix-turn-helix domain-containing protein [Synechocystis sp. FACHB-383]
MNRINDGRDAGAFITSDLDDFGLDPYAFRIYGRIARRAGGRHGCFESIDNMAKACHMNRDTAYKAIKTLLKHQLIVKETHKGKTSNYWLTPREQWIPLPDLSQIRDTEPIPNQGHHLSQIRDTTYPKSGTPPIPNQGHKGINKGNPSKGTSGRWEISPDDDAVDDPFYNGQARQLAREVVKVSRQMSGVRNFITEGPWGSLAEELGKDAVFVWEEFHKYLSQANSDKNDPQAYANKIANNLYQNPGSELACKPWTEFADYFRKNKSAPPPPQKKQPRIVEIEPIPDREASAKAIKAAREAREASRGQ